MGSLLKTQKSSFNNSNQKGQIILEYILLLMIGVMVGSILVKKLTAISDDPENRGVIINRWLKIWDSIGKDLPDS